MRVTVTDDREDRTMKISITDDEGQVFAEHTLNVDNPDVLSLARTIHARADGDLEDFADSILQAAMNERRHGTVFGREHHPDNLPPMCPDPEDDDDE